MKTQELIDQATTLYEQEGQSAYPKVVDLYQQALESCRPEDEEEYLDISYELMFLHGDAQDIDRAAAHAEQCLQWMKPRVEDWALDRKDHLGRLYRRTFLLAATCIGWNTMQTSDDERVLADTLDLLYQAEKYARISHDFMVYNPLIRMLLRLDRREEAFRLAEEWVENGKDYLGIEDIVYSEEYQHWSGDAGKPERVVEELGEEHIDFLEKAAEITKQLNGQLSTSQIRAVVDQLPEVTILCADDAVTQFSISPNYLGGGDCLVVKGDAVIAGTLNRLWVTNQLREFSAQSYVAAVIFADDLTVWGDVHDDGLSIYVKGDLICDYVFSQDGFQLIEGDAHIRYGVCGVYNDGQFDVFGKLFTPYLIADDHAMPRQAAGNFIYLEAGDGMPQEEVAIGKRSGTGSGWGWEYFDHAPSLLFPEVWDEDGAFSTERFFALVRKGANPFHSR